jgi:hypothetical protein
MDDISLDFDKAFLRGDYTTNNPAGEIQFTGNFPGSGTFGKGYDSYLKNPTKLKELKLATGPDLRYSTEIDPTLIQDSFSGQYPDLKRLFHGSQTKGIKNLELPTGQGSTGGIYSLVDPKDPRFTRYVEGLPSKGSPGSGYVLQPRFEKELDINNMPEDMLQKLTNLEMYRGRPSRLGSEKLDFDINQVLRGENFMRSKTPMHINKDFADIFTKEGYDALRFPPRAMKGEGETVVALDPSKLDIVDEIPFDQLDDYIRTLLND